MFVRLLGCEKLYDLYSAFELLLLLFSGLDGALSTAAPLRTAIRPLEVLAPPHDPDVLAVDVLAARRVLGREPFEDPFELCDELVGVVVVGYLLWGCVLDGWGALRADGGCYGEMGLGGALGDAVDGVWCWRGEATDDAWHR